MCVLMCVRIFLSYRIRMSSTYLVYSAIFFVSIIVLYVFFCSTVRIFLLLGSISGIPWRYPFLVGIFCFDM